MVGALRGSKVISFKLALMHGQVDAFQRAVNDFVARLESTSDDFVFLTAEAPSPDSEARVFKISTGEEDTLYACLDHVQSSVRLPAVNDS